MAKAKSGFKMTIEEVQELVRIHAGNDRECTNDHRISLEQALVPPQKISVIVRTVQNGRVKDKMQDVWLIGQEDSNEGYRIVMSEDRLQFGLASTGFPADRYLVLTGWYD
ncbi:MAG: hypothetical protein WBE38_02625, partial [Terracidiphilus sp.]